MSETRPQETRDHEFREVAFTDALPQDNLTFEDLKNVRLNVSADLGSTPMMVREILELKQGSVVPLDKPAGEMSDVFVNGVPLAKGEVVIIGDSLHVRIAEIFGAAEPGKEVLEDEE